MQNDQQPSSLLIDLKFEDVQQDNNNNSFENIIAEKPAAELSQSQYEEKQVMPPVLVEEVKQPEVLQQVVEESSLKEEVPKLSMEEMEKLAYLEKLAQVKEAKLVENLKHFLEMGYTNFEVNLSLLRRNKNDLIVAMNMLCNGLVTDSMFQWLGILTSQVFKSIAHAKNEVHLKQVNFQ